MTEKLWSECSQAEHEEVGRWEKKARKFKKELSKGYYTWYGEKQKKKELKKELTGIERKYEDDEQQLALF